MKVVVFGATGMVGQGVVRECLLDDDVESVVSIGRSASGVTDPKFREVLTDDLLDLSPHAADLAGVDACFFCLGVSSTGMNEADYRQVTYDITMTAAAAVAGQNPAAVFVYVSGAGADATSRTMWARVRGETENALLATSLDAYVLRPGFIQSRHGARSRTLLYRVAYPVFAVLFPVLRRVAPKYVSSTEQIGLAMLSLARHGAPDRVLYSDAFNAITP
ncbi:MAG: NAD(P)H-binding protein [Actinophytocola sp.]|uniref:NAD(P)H-binding protein n=1 Tax=Actinophytocola sp. TaxID=1872138 RepID=UPI003C78AB7C